MPSPETFGNISSLFMSTLPIERKSKKMKIHPDQDLENAIQKLNEVWHKED